MKNELFHIGNITVYGYGLMIAIAIISAYMSAEYRAKKRGLEYDKIFNLTIWCAVGGLLGAKLLYYVTVIPKIIEDPSILLDVADGFVVYGGIIFGILAGFLYCRRRKWNFLQYFDLVMPSIALAQGFGRIGCFLSGCCYGEETHGWLAITFHESHYAPNGVPLIPTQLLSSGLDFLHFFALLIIAKRNKVHGVIAGCYLMFYSAGRFVIEFFRGDLERGAIGPLSTSQFIAIFLFLFGLGVVIVQSIRAKKHAALKDDAKDEIAADSETETVAETESDEETETKVAEDIKAEEETQADEAESKDSMDNDEN